MFDDEPQTGDLEHHYAYLKGSRQDPQPWENDGGPSTAPMTALTPPVLAEMDQKVAGEPRSPQRAVEGRTTRIQARQRRNRRRFVVGLILVGAVVFALSFLLAASHII